MHFLIDADSVVFKAGCANEIRKYEVSCDGEVVAEFQYKKDVLAFIDENPEFELTYEQTKEAGPFVHSVANAKSVMKAITESEHCTSYEVFLGGQGNFRKEIYPDYKGNRDDFQRPIHENKLKKYLYEQWQAQKVTGEEVDDVVSYRVNDKSCIVTIDKDLDNTPGWHYNYDKRELYYIDAEQADLNFYRQLLTGDSTDNIPGLKGVGKGTAKKLLPVALSVEDMCDVVWEEYKKRGHDEEYFLLNAQLIWIRREEDELWKPPIELT